jgi:hypothetical protein
VKRRPYAVSATVRSWAAEPETTPIRETPPTRPSLSSCFQTSSRWSWLIPGDPFQQGPAASQRLLAPRRAIALQNCSQDPGV